MESRANPPADIGYHSPLFQSVAKGELSLLVRFRRPEGKQQRLKDPIVQTTLRKEASLGGTGLHTGRPVRLRLCPAPAGSGISFVRTDIGAAEGTIPARWDMVSTSPLNTRIENAQGASVSTVEHLMAAFAGTGVHNARVLIDGPEVPALDGSSAGFARAILGAGVARLAAPLDAIEVLEPVEVRNGGAAARLDPGSGLHISFAIQFPDAAIGHQVKTLDMANGTFLRELADCRTFCRQADVDDMRAQGKGLGGTLFNAVVVDGEKVLTPGGLRHADEPVRHKMLDALGDLMLAGAPLIGHYSGVRAGHALTNQLLRALFARPEAWRMRRVDHALAAHLPGSHLQPGDLARVA